MSTLAFAGELTTAPAQTRISMKTAVAGVTGYAGAELARLLLAHPRLQESQPLFLGRMDAAADSTTLYDLHPHLARNDGRPAPPGASLHLANAA